MKLKEMIKLDKSKLIILIMALTGISLILISSLGGKEKELDTVEYTEVGFYTSYLEGRITDLCNSIYGVSDTKVFLTLDTSSEYVYQGDGVSDFLILSGDGGETAVKLCEVYPRVRGIAVVCGGGDIPRVKEAITELLSAALGLPTNKIKVAGS